MRRTRLLFKKTGRAKYISHLDLMRTFQRVFLRAGVSLRHTEGFNPHPYMNFALPLSVGVESICELLDFDISDAEDLSLLPVKLNKTMPEGVEAVKAYQPTTKFSDIAWLEVDGQLIYDKGASADTVKQLTELYTRNELIIPKKSKRGLTDTNIIPCIHSVRFVEGSDNMLLVNAVVTAQNPSLNPEHLISAISVHMPALAPDFASFRRVEVYDGNHHIYR